MDNRIDPAEVADYYNAVKSVWPDNEPWYQHTIKEIDSFIRRHPFNINDVILNAGCGDSKYQIHGFVYNVDIAEEKIKNKSNSMVSSIEQLPFDSHFFDGIVCVGSVINYCDPLKAISELSRVLRPHGKLIIEFESSASYEYFGTHIFSKDVELVFPTYQGHPHKIWVYSPDYIKMILNQFGFRVIKECYFHILSTLSYYFYRNEDKASKLAFLDPVARLSAPIRKHGCNVIMECIKL